MKYGYLQKIIKFKVSILSIINNPPASLLLFSNKKTGGYSLIEFKVTISFPLRNSLGKVMPVCRFRCDKSFKNMFS